MEAEQLNLEKAYDDGKTDEKIEIAKKMFAKGKSMEELLDLTNLTIE